MSKKITDPPSEVEWTPTVHFSFKKKDKDTPKNFEDIRMGDTLKVTVTGKVQSLREDEVSRSLEISMNKIRFIIPEVGASSMSETMSSVQEDRKT